jgi:hypothetical protein
MEQLRQITATGTLVAGGLLLVAFVGWELRTRAPMLPMRLFASRGFSAGNAAVFLWNASLTGATFFMAQFQQVSLGQDPLGAGLRLLPWGAAPFLIAPWSGRLADRIGNGRRWFPACCCRLPGSPGSPRSPAPRWPIRPCSRR